MKQMKDYYRYFYEDKIPLSQKSLKRYDRSPIAKRRQCELFLNSINLKVQQAQENINLANFHDKCRNLSVNDQNITRGQYQTVNTSFANRTYIPYGASYGVPAQMTLPYQCESEVLNSCSDESSGSSSNHEDGAIDTETGDEPMDLTVDLTYNTQDDQAIIFEGLSQDPSGSVVEGEALDLSMKTSKSKNISNLHNAFGRTSPNNNNNNWYNRNNENNWNLVARPANGVYNSNLPCTENGSTLSNQNSILYKILKERAVINRMSNGLQRQRVVQGSLNHNPTVHPAFPQTEFDYNRLNHHLVSSASKTRYQQQTSPTVQSYRNHQPVNQLPRTGSGPQTQQNPHVNPLGPLNSMALSVRPVQTWGRNSCPQRGQRHKKSLDEEKRPSLKNSILKEMGIQTPSVESFSSASTSDSSSPVPSESGSGSSSVKREDMLDVVKVQNVYVNYLRQLMGNAENASSDANKQQIQQKDERPVQVKDQVKEELKSYSDEKTTECVPSSDSLVIQETEMASKACQNEIPDANKVQNKKAHKDVEKDEEANNPISSDIMAIIQAQVLKKSLYANKEDAEIRDDEKGPENSGWNFINSLIEDEFKEAND